MKPTDIAQMTTSMTKLKDEGSLLRIRLKKYEVEVAKQRDRGNAYHENSSASRLNTVAMLS